MPVGTISIAEFKSAFSRIPGKTVGPSPEQWRVIEHAGGPALVMAGPGSGKSLCLALRTLKLVTVDGAEPRSIIVTTFTERAATMLRDRILGFMSELVARHPALQGTDIGRVRIGTLHALCYEIMAEYQFEGAQNYRLMSALEQRLFLQEVSSFCEAKLDAKWMPIIRKLGYAFEGMDATSGKPWLAAFQHPPRASRRSRVLGEMFSKVIESGHNLDSLRAARNPWNLVAELFDEYSAALEEAKRLDFTTVQSRFLNFLEHDAANLFLRGTGHPDQPGIRHVMVDEYQDTNVIQESIYFRLAQGAKHDLMVVGDEDQAIYRFRGGTVECIIRFPTTCAAKWKAPVAMLPLSINFRSVPDLVKHSQQYLLGFPQMHEPGARVPGKPPLQAARPRHGFQATVWLSSAKKVQLGHDIATTIIWMLRNQVVSDPSQCAVLLRSTKGERQIPDTIATDLAANGIPIFNPASSEAIRSPAAQIALGALIEILDPSIPGRDAVQDEISGMPNAMELVDEWRAAYATHAATDSPLSGYVEDSRRRILNAAPKSYVGQSLPVIFAHILSRNPLGALLEGPASGQLALASRLIESFSMTPIVWKSEGVRKLGKRTHGSLRTDASEPGIDRWWLRRFYYNLLPAVLDEQLDVTDDEGIPLGAVPLMTIHQSKGLEFPVVIMAELVPRRDRLQPGHDIRLERELRKVTGAIALDDQDPVRDLVRLYYVALTRAENLLVLATYKNQEDQEHGIGLWYGGGVSLGSRLSTRGAPA